MPARAAQGDHIMTSLASRRTRLIAKPQVSSQSPFTTAHRTIQFSSVQFNQINVVARDNLSSFHSTTYIMAPTINRRNPTVPVLLIVGLLMNVNHSSAFSTAIAQAKRQQLHLGRSDNQGAICMPENIPVHEPHQQLPAVGEITREINTAIMTRRDSIFRGMGLAFATATLLHPTPATAFFDYEGERTGYTYQPPPPSVGIPSASSDRVKTPLPENMAIPETTSQSTEAQLQSTDEPSPGLRDSYLLQSTTDQRTNDYQRLEETEDGFVYTLETDHYDGMYF
jgi:hypothetical protein